ncbi:hypothetical protein DFQ27_003526 [Actinomortierella ambigua]|uniref:Cyclic nucleotide-binding domain-containing protein n=1 Tax=Actinomortierella ambigua TaxID=1343610 RepID=A0A9P6Q8R4_9FUNG|nr:hypothetical protein DFQ27_003526 [Actinomortierella ambigua]
MMHIRHYHPQDHIINRSGQSSAMFYVLRGSVRVASHDNESTYYEIKENNFFGDFGFLSRVPRSMDVLAKTRCTVAMLSGDDLIKAMEQSPEMAKAIGYQCQERYQIYLKRRQSANARRTLDGGTGELDACMDDSTSMGFARSDVHGAIRKVPLFSNCDSDVIHILSLNVEPRTYQLGETIIQRGEIGREMFFIVSGVVEILSEDNLKVLARFHSGQFFGEIAVLLDVPRLANVRAVSVVEVFVLSKDKLDAVFEAVPSAAETIIKEGNRLYRDWLRRHNEEPISEEEESEEDEEEKEDEAQVKQEDDERVEKELVGYEESLAAEPDENKKLRTMHAQTPLRIVTSVMPGPLDSLPSPSTASRSHSRRNSMEAQFRRHEKRRSTGLPPGAMSVLPMTFDGDILHSVSTAEPRAPMGYSDASPGLDGTYYATPAVLTPRTPISASALSASSPPTMGFFGDGYDLALQAPLAADRKSFRDSDMSRSSSGSLTTASLGSKSTETATTTQPAQAPARNDPTATKPSATEPMETAPDTGASTTQVLNPTIRGLQDLAPKRRRASVAVWAAPDLAKIVAAVEAKMASPSPTDAQQQHTPASLESRMSLASLESTEKSEPGQDETIPATVTSMEGAHEQGKDEIMAGPTTSNVDMDVDVNMVPVEMPVPTTMTTTTAPQAIAESTLATDIMAGESTPLVSLGLDSNTRQPLQRASSFPTPPKPRDRPVQWASLGDHLAAIVFNKLPLGVLLTRVRATCREWNHIVLTHPLLLQELDLSGYKKVVSDTVLSDLCASVLSRAPQRRTIKCSLRDCFLITDQGLTQLAQHLPNLRDLDLHSCWNVTDQGFKSLAMFCPQLRSVDFSNCRKLGDDTILALFPERKREELLEQQQQPQRRTDVGRHLSMALVQAVRSRSSSPSPRLRDTVVMGGSVDTSMDEAQIVLTRQSFGGEETGGGDYVTHLGDSDVDMSASGGSATGATRSPRSRSRSRSWSRSRSRSRSPMATSHSSTFATNINCSPSPTNQSYYHYQSFSEQGTTPLRTAIESKPVHPTSTPPGCPRLASLNLSYCKNLTDKSFIHMSVYAGAQLESLNLQRCTTISSEAMIALDVDRLQAEEKAKQASEEREEGELRSGEKEQDSLAQDVPTAHVPLLQSLPSMLLSSSSSASASVAPSLPLVCFPILRVLHLSDCTFLTDAAIVALAKNMPNLQDISLSFCCALTDVAVESLVHACPRLEKIDLSFCGSAVSDASLYELTKSRTSQTVEDLEIRGCVRVSESGVKEILTGCPRLRRLNVSSCTGIGSGFLLQQQQQQQQSLHPPEPLGSLSSQTPTGASPDGDTMMSELHVNTAKTNMSSGSIADLSSSGVPNDVARKREAIRRGKEWLFAQQRPGLEILV